MGGGVPPPAASGRPGEAGPEPEAPLDTEAGSPELSRRHLALLALLALLLAVGMNLSLATNLGKAPVDSADRYFQSWQLAWNGHALLEQPLDFLQANAFWPLESSAAFSDALFGFAPAGLVGDGPAAALVRYNLVFLFCYAAAFFAAALLARELGLAWPAAVLAGAAFAYAPFRLAHHNHLHVLGSAPIPLALFLLLRGFRRGRPGLIVGGFLAAVWQVMIGFTLGIQLGYLLAVLGCLGAIRWWRAGRPPLPRRVVMATAAGAAAFAGWSAFQAVPYLQVLEDHPEARRTVEFVEFYSPPLRGFVAAPPDSLVWGRATEGVRRDLAWAPEMTLFPGAVVLLLAAVGIGAPVFTRRLRLGLAAGVLTTGLLALGFSNGLGRLVYGLLYELAPGWQSSRTPGRLVTLTSLALALLAGMGVHSLHIRSGAGRSRAVLVLPVLLTGLVLLEGIGRQPASGLSAPPVRVLPEEGPQLHLPSDESHDLLYMFWSTEGFVPMVNGYSGFTPTLLADLRREVARFPDEASVDRLAGLGVRTVVLHPDLAQGTPWAGAAERPVDGLEVVRTERDGMVVFDLAGPGER